jgi:hypothetical protein
MSAAEERVTVHLPIADVALERDGFMRTLIGHLAASLQDIVGLEEAAGFVSIVGQRMGEEMNEMYRTALRAPRLSAEQVAAVCIDLKARIRGEFFVIAQDDDRIVFGNRACPFGDKVLGRPALCMMTSNVFGTIASENLGYGKVVIEQAIARGDPGCRVVVHLRRTPEAARAEGREYVGSE